MDLDEKQPNFLTFVAYIFLSSWLFQSITIWLKIHRYISYVGVFLLSMILSYIDSNFDVNFYVIEAYINYQEAFIYIQLLSTPAIIITLVLRVDFYRYEDHLIQIMILMCCLLGYQMVANMGIFKFLCLIYVEHDNEKARKVFMKMTSLILCPVETYATTNMMKRCTYSIERFSDVLHGEELISCVTVIFVYSLLILNYDPVLIEFKETINMAINIALGALIGLVSYIMSSKLISLAMRDPFANVTLFIGLGYLIYLSQIVLIGNAAVISLAIFGVLYNVQVGIADHTKLEGVKNFWDVFCCINHCILFTTAGWVVGSEPLSQIKNMFMAAVVLFIASLIVRFAFVLFMFSHSELEPFDKSVFTVVSLAGYKTGLPLLMSIVTQKVIVVTETQILPIVSFVVILNLLLQLLPFAAIIKLVGYYRLTDKEIHHMHMLWKKIHERRDSAIQCFTQNEMTRDANVGFLKRILRFISPRHTTDMKSVPKMDIKEEFLPKSKDDFKSFKGRILNIQLNIFQQREKENLLTLPAYRKLHAQIKVLIEKREIILRMSHISQTWRTLENLTNLVNYLEKITNTLPFYLTDVQTRYKNIVQLRIFEFIGSHKFQLFASTLILLDTIAIIYLIRYCYGYIQLSDKVVKALLIYNAIIYLISITVIILEIYALGALVFFRNKSKLLTFSHQGFLKTLMYALFLTDKSFPSIKDAEDIIFFMYIVILSQVWRLYAYIPILAHQLIQWITLRITNEVTRRIDTCNALIICFDQLARDHIQYVNTDRITKKKFILQMKAYKLEAIIALGFIRKGYPFVDIGLKTRIASQYIVNQMYNVYLKEKNTGTYGNKELLYFQEVFIKMNTSIRLQGPVYPQKVIYFLKTIKWLRPNFIDLFERNAQILYLNYGEKIVNQGSDPGGMFILVSGLLQCRYEPSLITMRRLILNGQLPNCDLLITSNFAYPRNIKMTKGCIIGELGTVTGRRYDMSVYSKTFAEVYHISRKFLLGLCHNADYSDIICGEIWQAIGCKWAAYLLAKNENYRAWPSDKLQEFVERGVIVIVPHGTPLKITYYVSEVILLEGVLTDPLTRRAYYAPYRINIKAVRNLIVGMNILSDLDVITRALVIPRIEATRDDILVKNLNTYKGFYDYDYEEVRHIISLEAKRYKTYRQQCFHWLIKRLSSSIADLYASPPLLPSYEDLISGDDRTTIKTGQVSIFEPASEVSETGIGNEQEESSKRGLDEIKSRRGTKVKSLPSRMSGMRNSVQQMMAKLRKVKSDELVSSTVYKDGSSSRSNASDELNRKLSIGDIYHKSFSRRLTTYKRFTFSKSDEGKTSDFYETPPRSPTDSVFKMIKSYYTPGGSIGRTIEFKDWRTLIDQDKYEDRGAQTDIKALIKPFHIPLIFEQSLNSLLNECLNEESEKKLRAYDEEDSSREFDRTLPAVGRRYLEKKKQYLKELEKKFPSVFRARKKQNIEVFDEKGFFDKKVIKETIKNKESDDSQYEKVKRCKAFSALKNVGREIPPEFRSQYDIIEENRFGESMSSYSRERTGDQFGRKKRRLLERKRRPLYQRKVCIKPRPKFKLFTKGYLKNKVNELLPKLLWTEVLQELYMVTKVQDLEVDRPKDHFVFQPPKNLWSVIYTSRFPRIPTPDDSYIKAKKDLRVYWSSSSSKSTT